MSTKVGDKLVKVNENFTVYRYDNGFMIEVSGRDPDDEYKYSKILCSNEDELLTIIKEINSLPLDE